ncbi:YopX family protein [Virgibacillus halodenitrificans]|uniref:YopX protein domain-containing protein n=1 Tax=Virgibacillus halodenitrificans TaxID=1482 RepID=A0ABR7VPP6_VIRHA|nr:YopX family protein [Virgibacillus halodenitrificans]MBD1223266.1 hypothetical protein [Virgibacillus halodenitrificans]
MREIKFKGKAMMTNAELDSMHFIHDNGWFVGNLIQNGNKPWIAGDIVESDPEYIVHDFWVRVNEKSIGQFTGLKDIEQFDKPKELYTGDIVSMHQFLFDGEEVENEIVGVLDYDEEVAAVCLTKMNNKQIQRYMGYGSDENGFKQEKIPVCMFYGLHECSWTYLGNIYENPELLEGESHV